MEDTIEGAHYPKSPHDVLAKTIKRVFELLRDYDLIEVRDSSKIITEKMVAKIYEEVKFERKVLKNLYPNLVRVGDDKRVPGQVFIEGQEYCSPFINSIYCSLILARKWEAICLFNNKVLDYCKYKFGSSLITDKCLGEPPKAFNTIFNSFLPEYEIWPEYVSQSTIEPDKCSICENEKKCSRTYLEELENNLSRYLEIRDYDEVVQIKKLVSDIIDSLRSEKGRIDHDSIIQEFRNKERLMTKRIRSTFPKIDRWSNLTLIASIPVAVVGIVTGLPVVSAVGAGAAGLSKGAQEYIKYLKSKYKWIGFVNKRVSTRQ
jgi:hypothetical protein